MWDLVPNDILFNIIKKLESNDTIYYNEEIFTFYEIGVITILNLKRINKYFYSFLVYDFLNLIRSQKLINFHLNYLIQKEL